MKQMMKYAFVFLCGMLYLYSLQIFLSPNLGNISAILAMFSGMVSVFGSLSIIIFVVTFFSEAWAKGDEKIM